MATKLFDTVNLYNTPALTDINPVAAEDVQIDLAAIGSNVDVNFPATGIAGQCIGVCLLAELAPFEVGYNGPVDVLVSSTLTKAGDCELFTWDSAASLWRLVAAYRQPAAAALQWLTPGGGATPVNGDFSIDSGGSTITLPEAPAEGTYVAVKSTNGNTVVQAQGSDSIDQGDGTTGATFLLPYAGVAAIFVYGPAGIWWAPAVFDTRPQLTPSSNTGTTFTPGLSDMGSLLVFTDGGAVTVTIPAQADVAWPRDARLDFAAQGGNLTIVGDSGVAINVRAGKDPTSEGSWSRMTLERCDNGDPNQWLLSGDLADSGP